MLPQESSVLGVRTKALCNQMSALIGTILLFAFYHVPC